MNFKQRIARKLYMQRETAKNGYAHPASSCDALTSGNTLSSRQIKSEEDFSTFSFARPTPGLATRQPALKQAKTSRGHSIFRGTVLWHESMLELRVSYKIQTWHGVREIHSQYPVVTYIDADGKTRTHTFDYYVVFEDGRRMAIAVKMNRKRAQMLEMLEAIEAAGISFKGGPRLADETRLMTEKEATLASFHNSSEILNSRKTYTPEAVDELREIVRRMTGRFKFMTLLTDCQNVAARRAAIWHLIDLGELLPQDQGRIDELTWLIGGMANPMSSKPRLFIMTREGERTCLITSPCQPASTLIPTSRSARLIDIGRGRVTTSRSIRTGRPTLSYTKTTVTARWC